MSTSTCIMNYKSQGFSQFMRVPQTKKSVTYPMLFPTQHTRISRLQPSSRGHTFRYDSQSNQQELNDSPHNFIKRRNLKHPPQFQSSRLMPMQQQRPKCVSESAQVLSHDTQLSQDRYALIPINSLIQSRLMSRDSSPNGPRKYQSPPVSPRQETNFSKEDYLKLFQIQSQLKKLKNQNGQDPSTFYPPKPYMECRVDQKAKFTPMRVAKPETKTRFRFNVNLKGYNRQSEKVDLLMQMVEESRIERWEQTDDSMQ